MKSFQKRLTAKQAAYIKWYLKNTGLFQHEIAAHVGLNQGRVSEVKQGKRFAGVKPECPPFASL